jgi:acetyl esterase/lipase
MARINVELNQIGAAAQSASPSPTALLAADMAYEPSLDVLSRPQPPAGRRIRYGVHPSQFAELRLPAGRGPHPVVVGIHGGWWRAAHGLETHAHLCHALTQAGFATWNIEYRRLGEPGCSWLQTLADAGNAIDHLAEIAHLHALDLRRLVTVGFSAGGQLALWAAARAQMPAGHPLHAPSALPLKAAISLAGAVDLAQCAKLHLSEGVVHDFLGGDAAQVPLHYALSSPIELLPLNVPHVLIQGQFGPFRDQPAIRGRGQRLSQ